MAYVDEQNIRDAIREVLTGALAGVRGIPADTISADAAEGMTDLAMSQRALVLPTVTVAIAYAPLDEPVPQPSNLWLERLIVTIKLTTLLATPSLPPAVYDSVKSGNGQVGSAIRLAFSEPGALRFTSALAPTGILSGVLRWTGASVLRDQAPQQGQAQGGGLYETQHTFEGFVQVDAVTS